MALTETKIIAYKEEINNKLENEIKSFGCTSQKDFNENLFIINDIDSYRERIKETHELLYKRLKKNISEEDKILNSFDIINIDFTLPKKNVGDKIEAKKKNCRILVVEDVQETRDSIIKRLKSIGISSKNILAAESRNDAEQTILNTLGKPKEYFDIIITDMYMEDKKNEFSGIRFCEFLSNTVKPEYIKYNQMYIGIVYAVYRLYIGKRIWPNWTNRAEVSFMKQLLEFLKEGVISADLLKRNDEKHETLTNAIDLYLNIL